MIKVLFFSSLLLTVGVLGAGIVGLSLRTAWYQKYSHTLMGLRVLCQAVTVGLFALLMFQGK